MYIQFIPLTFTLAVLLKSQKKYRSASQVFIIISFSFAKLIKKRVTKTNARNKFNFINISATACRILNQELGTPISAVSRGDTYPSETHCKLRRSAAVGKYAPPKMSSPKGDLHILSDIEDDSRSRFAEPGEGEVMLIPQLRSFGSCSGFLMDTCPLGTRR